MAEDGGGSEEEGESLEKYRGTVGGYVGVDRREGRGRRRFLDETKQNTEIEEGRRSGMNG
jgi:hypothetical protein